MLRFTATRCDTARCMPTQHEANVGATLQGAFHAFFSPGARAGVNGMAGTGSRVDGVDSRIYAMCVHVCLHDYAFACVRPHSVSGASTHISNILILI